MTRTASNGAMRKEELSPRQSRVGQSRRGPLIIGMLLGAGITSCIQSMIWSIRHTSNMSSGNMSFRSALENSKRRRSRLDEMTTNRHGRRAESALFGNKRNTSNALEKQQSVSIVKGLGNDEIAPDDDDLANKLRAVRESQVLVNQAHSSPFQQRMAAHQERMRLIRERQQQQQQQLQQQPQQAVRQTNTLTQHERLKAARERLKPDAKSPTLFNERQRKTLPSPPDATIVDWDFQPIETLQGDPFGMSDICDASTKRLRSPDTSKRKQICIQGKMPNFTHSLPHFLGSDREIFLLQPENQVAIKDDWVDWAFQTCAKFPLEEPKDIFAKIEIGGIQSFQHFHDNALGLIYQARQAFDLIQNGSACGGLTEYLDHKEPRNSIVAEEWKLLGFYAKRPLQKVAGPNSIEVEITFYSQDFDQVRVHPIHVDYLRHKMPVQRAINPNKVVYLSRQGSNAGALGRQFKDEADFETRLRQRIPGFEKFRPGKDNAASVGSVFDNIGDACMIIGVHGGHMYNQYFTGPKTAVLEIMAVSESGLFHGQSQPEQRPSLAHRAIWHNANVIRQPYWRLHFKSEAGTNFELDDATMDKIAEAAKTAGCVIS